MTTGQPHELHPHVSPSEDRMCHQRLPMGDEEKVIAIYRHHWFSYASVLFIGIFAITAIFGLVAVLIAQGGDGNLLAQYKDNVVAGTVFLSILILLFTLIPIWLRSQEKLILSDDSVYQTLQPSLFSGKVSQLNLAHLADVTVRQDFFGTIFGYGHLTLETPGEQDNFEYSILRNAQNTAREILEVHENYIAALESGRLPTTFQGTHAERPQPQQIDPREYQEFLEFQRMKRQAEESQTATGEASTDPGDSGSATDSRA